MKRTAMVFLAVLLVMTAFAMPVSAEQNLAERQLITRVQAEMLVREIGTENLEVEVINNTSGEPKYLLGTSESGYIILDKDNFVFYEAGERNPFATYKNAQKYYGGPLCYFVEDEPAVRTMEKDTEYYDVVNRNYVRDMYAVEFNERDDSQNLSQQAVERANTTPVRVSNAYNYIRRRAFGYNNDNTCSAVATGIVLNYLSLQYDKPFVADIAELRNNGTPANASELANKYPNAHALHRCLVDDYGMGAASFGDAIADPLISYMNSEVPGYHGFTVSWTASPRAATIRSNIVDNKPVLVTTTLAGDYSLHTMACYGYRVVSDYSEILVHTGWYGSDYNDTTSTGAEYQTETWISESFASIGYYFSFNE